MKKIISVLLLMSMFLTVSAETLNIPLKRRDDGKNGFPYTGKSSLIETPICYVDSDGELTISAMGEISCVSISDETGFVIYESFGDENMGTYSIPTLSQGNYIIEVEVDEIVYSGEFSF